MVEGKEENMRDYILRTFSLSLHTGQLFFQLFFAPKFYQTFCNEGNDKEKKILTYLDMV